MYSTDRGKVTATNEYLAKARASMRISRDGVSKVSCGSRFSAGTDRPLFWVVHLSLHSREQERHIRDLTHVAGHLWHHFVYPLCTGATSQRELDKFVLCLSYFITQAIQDIFIRLLEGNPATMDREFRMRLCARLVFFFTGIRCADTLLKSSLAFFFHSPPQADVPDRVKREDSDAVAVKLPTEDPRTLIEIEKRQRRIQTVWEPPTSRRHHRQAWAARQSRKPVRRTSLRRFQKTARTTGQPRCRRSCRPSRQGGTPSNLRRTIQSRRRDR
jgi:hypothetical protein